MIRFATRASQILIDLGVLSVAVWLAFMLRFDWQPPALMFKRLIVNWPYIVGLQYVVMMAAGVTRYAWRYVGLREINRIFMTLGAASGVLLAVRLLTGYTQQIWGVTSYALIPLGVIAADFILAFLGVGGVRVLRRILAERASSTRLTPPSRARHTTLLIGAGQAGSLVAREIAARPDLGIHPIGFVDDDPVKLGTVIHGLPVLGTTSEIAALTNEYSVEQAVITISNAPGAVIRKLAERCEHAGIRPRIIPGIHELIDGRVNLSRLRDVSVEDLLRRDPIELDTHIIRDMIANKRVLVTGAGGSIGSELCRQVAQFRPARLLLVERSEFHLFSIHRELSRRYPDLSIEPLMCDVGDQRRVEEVFATWRPEVVFHAAAHKHVPMMEANPGEAIKNNVFGTRCVADAADRHGASAFVMVSTDKAVNPTSVMGATKRVAEIYIQALSRRSKTRYVAVRFGNVLGSAGSVIPIFKDQIAAGGPVTVTHPDMQRYFMTIPEASQLVLQAGTMGRGGEIFVLDMGEPVRIIDLARDLIRLSGLEPDVDVPIRFIGVRPGEKLFEELGFDAERMDKTRHPKVFVGKLSPLNWEQVHDRLEVLARYTQGSSREIVRAALMEAVPEMQDDARVNPDACAIPDDQRQDAPRAALMGSSPALAAHEA